MLLMLVEGKSCISFGVLKASNDSFDTLQIKITTGTPSVVTKEVSECVTMY